MTKTARILLIISITTFTLSFFSLFSDIGWGILRPVGAVTFILFFIVNLLAKEMAIFDEEHRHVSEPVPATSNRTIEPTDPASVTWGVGQKFA